MYIAELLHQNGKKRRQSDQPATADCICAMRPPKLHQLNSRKSTISLFFASGKWDFVVKMTHLPFECRGYLEFIRLFASGKRDFVVKMAHLLFACRGYLEFSRLFASSKRDFVAKMVHLLFECRENLGFYRLFALRKRHFMARAAQLLPFWRQYLQRKLNESPRASCL